ncbi:MAG TPA: XRE family transcriptional regulator [Clostridium sp.]|nr:XRE family transcriptional regulator [Clostridium sp.]
MVSKIKNKRMENGLKQIFVAEHLGFSTRHYQRIEKGEVKKVNDETFKKLSFLFRCNIKDLKEDSYGRV